MHLQFQTTSMEHSEFIFFIFWSFCLFRAAPMAYGGFQARIPSELKQPAYATATAV